MKDWLTITDIAQETGLAIDTIYTYRKRNTLPEADHYIGNKPLWKHETITNWNEFRKRSNTIEMIDENGIYYSGGVN